MIRPRLIIKERNQQSNDDIEYQRDRKKDAIKDVEARPALKTAINNMKTVRAGVDRHKYLDDRLDENPGDH